MRLWARPQTRKDKFNWFLTSGRIASGRRVGARFHAVGGSWLLQERTTEKLTIVMADEGASHPAQFAFNLRAQVVG
jgi:hypothetical protein